MAPKPTYKLSCRNNSCKWEQPYFFDQILPQLCPVCNRPNPAIENLAVKTEIEK